MTERSSKRSELELLARAKVQRSGLRDLSFRSLAEEVGVKSSSVHYYFPEKNDLTATLIGNYSQDFLSRLTKLSTDNDSLITKLMAFIDLFAEAATDDKVCLCGMLAAELSALDERCQALLEGFFKTVESWLASVLNDHKGDVASSLPPAKLAAAILSGLEGALLLDRAHCAGAHLQAQRQLILSLVIGECKH